jgi:hypothetical protein
MIQDIRGIMRDHDVKQLDDSWSESPTQQTKSFEKKQTQSSNQRKRRSFEEENKQLFIYDPVVHARITEWLSE